METCGKVIHWVDEAGEKKIKYRFSITGLGSHSILKIRKPEAFADRTTHNLEDS